MSEHWVVLGHEQCSYCHKVRDLLKLHGKEHTYFNIRQDVVMKEFLVANGLTSVPQVFLNGFLLGGYEATENYLSVVEIVGQLSFPLDNSAHQKDPS